MKATQADLAAVCSLANELCGIQWDESKQYLVESRLAPLLKTHGYESYEALVRKAKLDRTLRNEIIDAVTTRETLFFRDESPFIALEHKVLPEIIDRKEGTVFPKRLRIWSAACSSGQEPYSIAIMLTRLLPDIESWDIKILATDISDSAIAQASRGVYSEFETGRGLTGTTRERYFQRVDGGWKIRDEIRSMISFEKRNLLEPFIGMNMFDVIFCRNVAIYFDLPVKRDLFERLSKVLNADGALFVGSSESLASFGERWKPQQHCRAAFYQPNMPAIQYV